MILTRIRKLVAVGMPVTRHSPHSSVPRPLTYTAPTPSIWHESAFQDKDVSLVLLEDSFSPRGQTLRR